MGILGKFVSTLDDFNLFAVIATKVAVEHVLERLVNHFFFLLFAEVQAVIVFRFHIHILRQFLQFHKINYFAANFCQK